MKIFVVLFIIGIIFTIISCVINWREQKISRKLLYFFNIVSIILCGAIGTTFTFVSNGFVVFFNTTILELIFNILFISFITICISVIFLLLFGMVKKFNTASNVIFLIIFVVSSLSFTTIFDYYNLQAERKEEIYKSNIEYKQEIIELETKQHELIYFNNIPVQKVSGSVFGKFNFGSGNVSGQISTTDEISYWYLVGDKQALHYSVPTSKSVLTFYEEGTQKPCVNFHKKAKKIITINHNDGSQKSKTEPETWYEYVFYLPQSVMLSN